ncbi:MAG: valine--pyruvate transaminase [Desulfobacterales bacterium GWB2_56_26]|nr:MAG: valine--pyruvate transaminase [Desulfobacterales bacterium GWB2_56_26]
MEFTQFGRKMTGNAGILSLMDDLGKATACGSKPMIMMGGGNPGQVPEFQEIMRQRLLDICRDPQLFHRLIGSYSPPQGDKSFVENLAALLKKRQGWDIGPENICLTNGSQTAFFMLFNLLAGSMADGRQQKICLPMAPEYIGYADLGLTEGLFVTTKPDIELLDGGFFKYHIDFDRLEIGDDIGVICISRPTNPTGNVVTDAELARLIDMAARRGIPLIIDSAYGLPFPGMVYTKAESVWLDNLIVCLSLSKLGLPAIRTGLVVAKPAIVAALTAMNAIMSLAPTSFGALLAGQLVASEEIIGLSHNLIQPFYRAKMEKAVAAVREFFAGIPCRMHKPEGAMFLWLWFEDLPITSLELYQILKTHGVLVVSGHYFFPGLGGDWRHKDECIRVNYSLGDAEVRRGLEIIAGVVRQIYNRNG